MKALIFPCCILLPCLLYAQQEEFSVPGQNLFVNKINVVQSHDPWLNGSGITVSIKEYGFDTTDVDLRGRVISSPNASTNQTIHANIIASLAGGAGNADLQGRGVASGCRLVSSSFVGLQPDADYGSQNISVQNHSYGVDIQNWYGAGALAYDRTTAEYPGLLHVFSAGNKGDSSSLSGTYAGISGFANLSGNFKMAKNVLIVGSVDSLGQVISRNSRGPAYDGRIKPELVAFGHDGSSGAAALVSGSAAAIQQALANDGHRSDLVRAILINTADDLGAPGPDFESGFGNLNLKNAFFLSIEKRFTKETISEGQTISIPIMVPENIRKVNLTLVWNDPPAALLTPKALLNDLDLTLLDPTGNEYSPWILNSFPVLDSLRQPAHRGRDTLNNVEQITVDFPASGLWEIRVAAPPVLSGSQDFALAWSWDTMQHFDWTYPSLNDPVPANREVILRWENNFSDSFARLEWRPLLSPNWRLINDSIQLQRGWQRWIIPDTFTEAQVRMMVGAKEFRSDIFLISKELRVKIGLNCPDSVLLFWNAAHSTAQYQLYGLGAIRMEPILTVSDTFVVLQKSAFPQERFAVAPFTPEFNAYGPRSPAPDISNQGVACYFRGLLANLNADFNVDLNLSVGTNYGLSKIYFEKLSNGSFTVLNEQNAQQLEYSFLDETLQKGINTYRARILLDNGSTLLSDTVRVYFGGENNWWVFPNPVSSEGILSIVAATDELAGFMLFDVLGNLILEKTTEELVFEIPLNELPKGVYFYKVNDGETFLGGGKLIVE